MVFDAVKIERALILSEKPEAEALVKELHASGAEIYSSGKSAELFRHCLGKPSDVIELCDYSGFPSTGNESADLIAPRIFGSFLLDHGDPNHTGYMDEQGIKEFGLLAVDIGPLDGSLKLGDAIKATRNQIGRIALARGTAKNFRRALVSVNPDYDSLSEQVRGGTSDFAARYGQVAPTFGFTSGYAGDLASTFCRTEVGELSLFGENLEWNPDPALMSVTDKTKIEILAAFMYEKGIKVVSSGGTAKYIGQHVSKEAVTDTSYYTGFPASPDHLVVTLHPELHAASLIGTGQQHERFGLVVINLYDFEQAAREPQYTPEDVRWKVDIGGPSRLWTALLDFPSTAVVFRPSDYGMIMDEIARGDRKSSDSLVLRYNLAKDTLGHLAVYDRSIADYFSQGRTDFVRGFYLEG